MINIMCYGDSNTWGHNPANCMRFDENTRWTGRLAVMLGDGFRVMEEGLCGRTTVFNDGYSTGRNGLAGFIPCMQSNQPLDLIIIMLGTNDLRREFNILPKEVARGVREIARTALNPMYNELYPPAKLLIISPIHIDESVMYGFFDEMFGEESIVKSKGLAAALENTAREVGAYFLDAAETAKASELDGIHMDERSHKALAEAVYVKVKEIFGIK
ncbi:MAG: SGNH/GDSL hydrolase family protein [Oscillospiraceae bacterium]|nr:SGNH/GDSL hydrolase family protein [Oscillospiraceae bacterium]